ncbi:MAG: CPBP family intramembrane metalloprotease, partial [Pseudobutyrivibrio sp.]|nr:CPBP family intramembrane metalloprotease [Pseudobutyrivibrio sp.]
SCLWNALYASAFGVFLAAIYLQSNSITMCMVLHAVWDIVIRIPGNFCENVKDGWVLTFINYSQDIIELGVFPLVATLICIKYKRNYKM